MARMKSVQVSKPNGPFEIVEREIPRPGPGQVLIKVDACGICHSDMLVKNGLFPGVQYPCVPGHEISGQIEAVGAGVAQWKIGQRVGVGWHGGHCFICEPCRRGDFILCRNGKITGFSFDGGYAEYTVVPAEAVAAMPEGISAEEAAPLLCAGITVFNSMRNSGTRSGDLVAVQGIGGLGHLGVQFARQMGFHTVAIGRGADKAPLAKKLGAHQYIDSGAGDPAAELKKLGGAKLVLATAPDAASISSMVGGLAETGKLLVVGVPHDPISVSVMQIVGGKLAIQGWPSGSAIDSEDTLRFSVLSGVRPLIEKYPLEKANEAYEQMLNGKARFRVVLTMGK
jgi:D-arabinose 1-dehydrogenase-like Zn-dependent alcohol dehydrogenase